MVCDLCGSGFWVYGWRQSGGSDGWQRCEVVVATMVVWGLGFGFCLSFGLVVICWVDFGMDLL